MWVIAVLICIGWVISLCLHEFGHAITAYWGGDKSVKEKGYLTLNPLKYTDPGLSLMMPLFMLMIGGIALPGGAVYINRQNLRDRLWESAVSVAGPFADVIIACVLAIPFFLGWHNGVLNASPTHNFDIYIYPAIAYIINLNIFVVLINLLPIPGLDGFGIIEPWLPRNLKSQISWLYQYGVWILFGLLWFVRPLSFALWSTTSYLANMLQIPVQLIVIGQEQFRQYSVFLVLGLIAILWVFRDKNKDAYRQGSQLLSQGKYDQALGKFNQLVQAQSDNVDALFMQGYTLFCLRRYDESLNSYARALELDPNSSQIYYLRGMTCREIGDEEAALLSFNRAIEYNPEDTRAYLEKAYLLFQQNNYLEALTTIDQFLELEQKQANAWELKADILNQLKQTEAAITAYQEAFNLQPNSLAWIKLVKLYERLSTPENNQRTQLEDLYTRKLRLQPHNPDLWYRQGLTYDKLNQPTEAAKSYQQGLELLQKQTKRHPHDHQAWYKLAKYLEKITKPEQAIAAYEQAVKYWQKQLQKPHSTANDWYEYGFTLETIQQYPEAISAYTQALTIDPQFYQAAVQISSIYLKNQDYNQALTANDQVLEYYAHNSSIWWQRAQILIHLEKYEQAIAACDRAIKIDPEYYGFWLLRGTVQFYLKDYHSAHAAYDTATQTNPNSDTAWNYKAIALLKLAQNPINKSTEHNKLSYLQTSFNALESAIKINPNNSDAWYNRACGFALQNNLESAISSLTQAMEIEPQTYQKLAQIDSDFDNIRHSPEFIKLLAVSD